MMLTHAHSRFRHCTLSITRDALDFFTKSYALTCLAVLLAKAKVYNEINRITTLQYIYTMKNYTAMEITTAVCNNTDNLKTQLKT